MNSIKILLTCMAFFAIAHYLAADQNMMTMNGQDPEVADRRGGEGRGGAGHMDSYQQHGNYEHHNQEWNHPASAAYRHGDWNQGGGGVNVNTQPPVNINSESNYDNTTPYYYSPPNTYFYHDNGAMAQPGYGNGY